MASAVAATSFLPREPMKSSAPLSPAPGATSTPTVVFLQQAATNASGAEPSKTSGKSLVSRNVVKLPEGVHPNTAIFAAKAAAIIAARKFLRQDPVLLLEENVLSREVEKIVDIYMARNPDLRTLMFWVERETSSYAPTISTEERIMVNIELRTQTYKRYIAHRTATWTSPQDRHAIGFFAQELLDAELMLSYSLEQIRSDIEASLNGVLHAQAQVSQ